MTEQTQEYILRAMSKNYAPGNTWDRLDIEACAKAADEIKTLREANKTFADSAISRVYGGVAQTEKVPLGAEYPDNYRLAFSKRWTLDQFWQFVEGLTDPFVRDQIRDTMIERGLSLTPAQTEQVHEALTLGRDAVMESFDHVADRDDQFLADARLQSIDAAIAGQPRTHFVSLPIALVQRLRNHLEQTDSFVWLDEIEILGVALSSTASGSAAQGHPNLKQIEAAIDDHLGNIDATYEDSRRRCAQSILNLYAVPSAESK